jgi:hypothetical protein
MPDSGPGDQVPTIGSNVADYFVAAVASPLPTGASNAAHQAAEKRAATLDLDHEPQRAGLLAERAALSWAATALERGDNKAAAGALQGLAGHQVLYVAGMLRKTYAKFLADDPQLQQCCLDAASALEGWAGLGESPSSDAVKDVAALAGRTLAAGFLGGAIDSIPDEVGQAIDYISESPLPRPALTLD